MTIPNERYRAIKQGKKLMEDLCDPGKTPRVPGIIRERARAALKHFPTDWDLEKIADKVPDLMDSKSAFTL